MTDKELKSFALVGMLHRITYLQNQLSNTKDEHKQKELDNLLIEYNNLLEEIDEIRKQVKNFKIP